MAPDAACVSRYLRFSVEVIVPVPNNLVAVKFTHCPVENQDGRNSLQKARFLVIIEAESRKQIADGGTRRKKPAKAVGSEWEVESRKYAVGSGTGAAEEQTTETSRRTVQFR
jgi:hypothetical protein